MPAPDPGFESFRFGGKPAHFIGGAIRESGLVSEGDRGVVLVSGGADSVALLLGLHLVLGAGQLVALHVNYGLRPTADDDERLVRRICEQLEVELVVLRAGEAEGNMQAWARKIRLDEAERIRSERGLDWIAVGHNRSDQVETFIYRLVSSPGARSLLAMPPRSGNLIRPLLTLDRGLIRTMLERVTHSEDPTNDDPAFARNRIRLEVMPALEQVNCGAELNVVRTRAELAEDEEALMRLAVDAVALSGAAGPGGSRGIPAKSLEDQPPAVRRRMIRHLAEAELDRPVAVSADLASDVLRLAGMPEGGRLDLGGGDSLLAEAGRVRVCPGGGTGHDAVPEPARIDLEAGVATFGGWEIESSRGVEAEVRSAFGDPWAAFLDLDDLLIWLIEKSPGPDDLLLQVRPWRFGDRIEPLGMSGSKSLQDVFTDALVPASRRQSWPVLVVGEKIIWVPGLVRSRHLLIAGPDRDVISLHARPPFSI